MASIA